MGLFLITLLLQKYHLGEKWLAFGIISIIAYIMFLCWSQVTTPNGPSRVEPFGSGYVSYAAVILTAFSTHDFIIQVIIHNPDRSQYQKIIAYTYALAGFIYIFIGLGCLGKYFSIVIAIVNRQPVVENPQII